jgi:hypothetical protein
VKSFAAAAAAETLGLWTEALQIRRKVRPAEHPDRIESLLDVAGLLEQQRRYAAADSLLQEALAGLAQSAQPNSAQITAIRARINKLHQAAGRPAGTVPGDSSNN